MEGEEEEEGYVDEEDVGMRDEEGDVDITDLNDEVGLKVIMVAHKSFDLTCMHELGARELGGHPLFFLGTVASSPRYCTQYIHTVLVQYI